MCAHNTYVYIWLDKELRPVDQCIAGLIIQLNQAGVTTTDSCCSHGKGYPSVVCAPGMEGALKDFGCKIVVTRKDNKVEAYFPTVGQGGRIWVP